VTLELFAKQRQDEKARNAGLANFRKIPRANFRIMQYKQKPAREQGRIQLPNKSALAHAPASVLCLN
jgi:hypothetical protein